ncbi:hypothetical protein [Algoriphagus sp. CAU 1675]|uniref:hypothetical protein n=1 Tax=Algoriphagus sp. CAU 1675 TaxID=3032597 RepID=UPI0023D99916|nr:hypothetical protein [Algoriphagus sp. CAU 1675]MDF2158098.1 hypothetical protein [Algoriphagus sp. CAU 1675]
MKAFLKIISIVLLSGLLIGCKTYRSIENVTIKDDPQLTNKENLVRQLKGVEKNEKIQVYLNNGKYFNLEYQSHTADSLHTILHQKAKANPDLKSSATINISLEEVDRILVWRTNYVLSIGVPAGLVIGFFIYASTWEYSLGSGDWTWD